MKIVPCRCVIKPETSSREAEPGAQLVDVEDERGRTHAVAVGERLYLGPLVEASAAELERMTAEQAAPVPERRDALRALALVTTQGALAPQWARDRVRELAEGKG